MPDDALTSGNYTVDAIGGNTLMDAREKYPCMMVNRTIRNVRRKLGWMDDDVSNATLS
jgi:hypothetical protein